MNEQLESYLLSTIKQKSDHIISMEKYASEKNVPIMEPLGIEFLMQLIRLQKPKRILEIGTAIGYSAIRMAEAYQDANIVSIERDEQRFDQALINIKKTGFTNRIEVIKGDALEESDQLEKRGLYDLLFIDAAKGQYIKFFEQYSQYVKNGGTIISDNVLFKGYVAQDLSADNDRLQKIAKKIRTYNKWLLDQPDFDTTIVPVGDGIAITVKK